MKCVSQLEKNVCCEAHSVSKKHKSSYYLFIIHGRIFYVLPYVSNEIITLINMHTMHAVLIALHEYCMNNLQCP